LLEKAAVYGALAVALRSARNIVAQLGRRGD
ncbi:MAG: hypothetical protein JWM85_2570, partial [Acidimicrobiaceae bacterium]|nr:hypothetical protein [Acidimicrobiaceae bacterium]